MDLTSIGRGISMLAASAVILAIVSVFVSKRSQAPALIQSTGTTFSQIIAAAVNPATAQTNGNNGLNTFTTPNISTPGL